MTNQVPLRFWGFSHDSHVSISRNFAARTNKKFVLIPMIGGVATQKKTEKNRKKPVPNLKFAVAFGFFRYFSVFFSVFFGFFSVFFGFFWFFSVFCGTFSVFSV